MHASNGLHAVDYLGQLNDLAANPEFVQQYRTDANIKAQFDKQLQQAIYLIQNENRATESVAFDRNLPTDNIAKLNAGLAYIEKGLDPVYPELWLLGTGSLARSGLAKLTTTIEKNIAKTPKVATPVTSNGTANIATGAKLNLDLKTTQSANEVVESLRTNGQLPSHYITKTTATSNGWSAERR